MVETRRVLRISRCGIILLEWLLSLYTGLYTGLYWRRFTGTFSIPLT